MRSIEPTARDVRIFGLLWLLFFGALCTFAALRPQALLSVATVLGVAWLVALVAQPAPLLARAAGCFVPLLLAFAGGATRVGLPRPALLGTLGGLGLVGAAVILAAPVLGARLYVWWMRAAEPVGWTVSTALLALIYYVVVTPIGLLLRAVGRDPLERRIDRQATSYWVARERRIDPKQYFRQF